MRSKCRMHTAWMLVGLLVVSTLSAGCEPLHWVGNANVNVVIPLGLGGTPGVLNPFGIVQALVNSMLGSSSDSSGSDGSSSSGASLPADSLDGAIGVVVQQ